MKKHINGRVCKSAYLCAMATLLIFLNACQTSPEAVLDTQRQAQNDAWLKDFTESKAQGFRPKTSKTSKQCNTQTLPGSWSRVFANKGVGITSGQSAAVWTFDNVGKIACAGSGCRRQNGVPERYAVREVFANTSDRNVGLFVIFDSNAIMRTTCEVDGNTLYFGNGAETGMKFVRST